MIGGRGVRVALAQIASTSDPSANLDLVAGSIRDAAADGARLVVLPEATMCRFGVPLGPVAEPLDGPWATRVRELADAAGVVVVAGMFTPAAGRVRNTLLVTGGGVDTSYDKIHMYDAHGFTESRTVEPGEHPVTFTVDGVTIGLATCYDVRFPGLFLALADDGAELIAVPASWAGGPGKRETWEFLVRARAMDCTSFVLACDQADPSTVGRTASKAPNGVGHSAVVDPYGAVVEALGPAPGLLVLDIDPAQVAAARTTLPVLANRRL